MNWCPEISMAAKTYLPFHVGYLPDWMVQKAKDELNETDENRDVILDEFRRMVENDKRFSITWKTDNMLMMFLRAKKFNVKRALESLNNFFLTRQENPDISPEKPDIENIRRILDSGFCSILSFRDGDGCAILNIKFAKWDPAIYSTAIGFSAVLAVVLFALQDPATQVCGVRVVLDMKDTNLTHVKHLRPKDFKLVGNALKSFLPLRVIAIHVVNVSTVTQILFNLLKVFLTKKIRNRFQLHGDNMEDVHQFIPKEILPPEYGGDNIHFNIREFCKKEMEPFYEKYNELHQ